MFDNLKLNVTKMATNLFQPPPLGALQFFFFFLFEFLTDTSICLK